MTPVAVQIPYLLAGAFYRLAALGWGDPSAPPVLCVHGLTRNAHDFDALAAVLATDFYVVAVDLPGRGASDWLPDPALYQPLSYVQALSHVLAAIGRPVAWVGTSLGGICGMLTASATGAPVSRMVLNDIGPFVPQAALQRIKDYIGAAPQFACVAEAAAYLRRVHAPFGDLSDAQWTRMAETSTRALPGGGLALHFDPAMTVPITSSTPTDMDLGIYWDKLSLPMLALRGETSDLLLPETFAAMGAKAALHTVPGCGHAPALKDDASIALIREFLLRK